MSTPALPDLRTIRVTRALLGAGIIGGLALTSGVALTATSGWLIVKASERPIILTLLTAIVAVRAFGMARPALRYWERLQTHDAALADLADRRVETYRALIPLTPARLGRRGRADLLTGVVDDLDDVVGAQTRVTVPGLSALIAWGLTTAITAAFDLRVGIALAVLGLVVVAVSWAAYRIEATGTLALGTARAEVTRVAGVLTNQAEEIAAINAGPDLLGELDAAHAQWRTLALRQARGRALAAGAILLAVGVCVLVVALMLHGEPWRHGVQDGPGHSPAVAALLVLVPVAIADALSPLAEAARALARAHGSAQRLVAVLDQAPAVRDPAGHTDVTDAERLPVPPRMSGRDLSARWTSERALALAPTDLDIAPGARLSIVGPNGSGKSTLLAVLARQLDPAGGSYRHDDRDALAEPLSLVRGRLAIVDDSPHLFAATLRANLGLAGSAAQDDRRCIDALRSAGLSDWFAGLPDGLDTRLGSGGRGVSGGERARLALARAVLSQRPVLMLDEPVAHLDSVTAREVLTDVLRAGAGRTVVMVSHRPDGRDAFEDVLELSGGTAAPGSRTMLP